MLSTGIANEVFFSVFNESWVIILLLTFPFFLSDYFLSCNYKQSLCQLCVILESLIQSTHAQLMSFLHKWDFHKLHGEFHSSVADVFKLSYRQLSGALVRQLAWCTPLIIQWQMRCCCLGLFLARLCLLRNSAMVVSETTHFKASSFCACVNLWVLDLQKHWCSAWRNC